MDETFQGFMVSRMFVLLAIVLCCSISYAEDTMQIPLSDVWAWSMPVTKDIRELDTASDNTERLLPAIRKAIADKLSGRKAGPAFIVEGTGVEALENAHAAFTDETPHNVLPHGKELSLVFFSTPTNEYVSLAEISRNDRTIEVLFVFTPHATKEWTQHIALIPLGKLEKGEYRVNISNKALKNDANPDGASLAKSQRISSSFVFKVNGK